jgi:hypothetical protein
MRSTIVRFGGAPHRAGISAGTRDYPPRLASVTRAGYRLNPDHVGLWIMELALSIFLLGASLTARQKVLAMLKAE